MKNTFANINNIPFFNWTDFIEKALNKTLTLEEYNIANELLLNSQNYPTSFYKELPVNPISGKPEDKVLQKCNLLFQLNIEVQDFIGAKKIPTSNTKYSRRNYIKK